MNAPHTLEPRNLQFRREAVALVGMTTCAQCPTEGSARLAQMGFAVDEAKAVRCVPDLLGNSLACVFDAPYRQQLAVLVNHLHQMGLMAKFHETVKEPLEQRLRTASLEPYQARADREGYVLFIGLQIHHAGSMLRNSATSVR